MLLVDGVILFSWPLSHSFTQTHLSCIPSPLSLLLFLQLNTHIAPRPVILTRHGESTFNVQGRIGGDPPLR